MFVKGVSRRTNALQAEHLKNPQVLILHCFLAVHLFFANGKSERTQICDTAAERRQLLDFYFFPLPFYLKKTPNF